MADRTYEFVQLDVFTQTPLAGNSLAIFTDSRGLDDNEMQALAREMNLSETTFILPRDPAIESSGREESPHLHLIERRLVDPIHLGLSLLKHTVNGARRSNSENQRYVDGWSGE